MQGGYVAQDGGGPSFAPRACAPGAMLLEAWEAHSSHGGVLAGLGCRAQVRVLALLVTVFCSIIGAMRATTLLTVVVTASAVPQGTGSPFNTSPCVRGRHHFYQGIAKNPRTVSIDDSFSALARLSL